MEKCVEGDFVGSADACGKLATLLRSVEVLKKEWGIEEDWVDTFIESEIRNFLVDRQVSMRFGTFLIADPNATKPILDLT